MPLNANDFLNYWCGQLFQIVPTSKNAEGSEAFWTQASRAPRDRLPGGSPKGKPSEVNLEPEGRARRAGRAIQTFEPIEPPWRAIRAWIPADDDESGTDTPELWDQSTGTASKAPEIDLGDGRTLVLDYS